MTWTVLFTLLLLPLCSVLQNRQSRLSIFFFYGSSNNPGTSPQSSTQCQQTFPCCTVCLVWLALGAREVPHAYPPLVPYNPPSIILHPPPTNPKNFPFYTPDGASPHLPTSSPSIPPHLPLHLPIPPPTLKDISPFIPLHMSLYSPTFPPSFRYIFNPIPINFLLHFPVPTQPPTTYFRDFALNSPILSHSIPHKFLFPFLYLSPSIPLHLLFSNIFS